MGRPKGKALTRDDVLAAGHTVVERDGFTLLTLSSVARELGIKPPSLCHHVASNEELRLLLAEQSWFKLAEQLGQRARIPDPRQRLIDHAGTVRRFALAHPRSFELMIHTRLPHVRVVKSPVASQLLLPLLASFTELGISRARRVHAARALRSAVTGFLLLEIAGQFQMEGSAEQSFDCLVASLLEGLCTPSRAARSRRSPTVRPKKR